MSAYMNYTKRYSTKKNLAKKQAIGSALGNERGSVLIVVLFVLVVTAFLVSGLLIHTAADLHSSRLERSSTEAFYAAETGLEAGKLAFEKTNEVLGIPSVTGELEAGSFVVRPGVGNFGSEKWLQWGYDEGTTRNNTASRIG